MGINLVAVASCVVVVLGMWSWALHLRQQRRIEALEGRLAHLTAGLSLLTDTTECGLRDLSGEVARLGGGTASRTRSRAGTNRRVAGAARRGHSIQAIAAAEQVSEGEVKLHLTMNGVEETRHAEMR